MKIDKRSIDGLNACYYCGIATNGIDHVPPRCVRPILLQLPIDRIPRFLEVSCCNECNSALGRRPLWTLTERKVYIKKWIKKRYKYYLKLPEWSDNELDKIGPGLRQHVEAGMMVAKLIRERLNWQGAKYEMSSMSKGVQGKASVAKVLFSEMSQYASQQEGNKKLTEISIEDFMDDTIIDLDKE
jgi:hypothetical protein